MILMPSTGKTQGITFRINPPMKAKSSSVAVLYCCTGVIAAVPLVEDGAEVGAALLAAPAG